MDLTDDNVLNNHATLTKPLLLLSGQQQQYDNSNNNNNTNSFETYYTNNSMKKKGIISSTTTATTLSPTAQHEYQVVRNVVGNNEGDEEGLVDDMLHSNTLNSNDTNSCNNSRLQDDDLLERDGLVVVCKSSSSTHDHKDNNNNIDDITNLLPGDDDDHHHNDEDYDDDVNDEQQRMNRRIRSQPQHDDDDHHRMYYYWTWILQKTLLPDNQLDIGGIRLVENVFVIKLLKFTIFTYFGIVVMYYFVRWIEWEHDGELKLQNIWTYESTLIINDIVLFFLVGRLYRKKGIDHIQWILVVLAANIYSSYVTDFNMFRHSFTLYEMHCVWPWQLWIFVSAIIPLIITIGILHSRQAWIEQIVVQKTLEMILCLIFTLGPYLGSPFFHLHHWYAGWLVGMHLNFDTWWSRTAMAWCWGLYINGIAVYGRDPVLTCGYALFISEDQRCPFVQCYLNALLDPEHLTGGPNNETQSPMDIPDWRNCSSTYKP